MPKRKPSPDNSEKYAAQDRLQVYGDGPYEPELGGPMGCQDVAVISFIDGFKVYREEYVQGLRDRLRSLEEAVRLSLMLDETAQARIKDLEQRLQPRPPKAPGHPTDRATSNDWKNP